MTKRGRIAFSKPIIPKWQLFKNHWWCVFSGQNRFQGCDKSFKEDFWKKHLFIKFSQWPYKRHSDDSDLYNEDPRGREVETHCQGHVRYYPEVFRLQIKTIQLPAYMYSINVLPFAVTPHISYKSCFSPFNLPIFPLSTWTLHKLFECFSPTDSSPLLNSDTFLMRFLLLFTLHAAFPHAFWRWMHWI